MEGFVLAGGQSTRMGRDKALLPVGGRPLIVHALDKLRSLGLKTRIVGSRPDLAGYAPVVEDIRPGCGPLGGIEAAVAASESDLNVFLPVDVPLLSAEFLRWMLDRATHSGAPATVPMLLSRPQPLCSVVHRDLLTGIRRALDHGEFKVIDALTNAARAVNRRDDPLDLFAVEALAPTQPEWPVEPTVDRWFQNVNRPADLGSLMADARKAGPHLGPRGNLKDRGASA